MKYMERLITLQGKDYHLRVTSEYGSNCYDTNINLINYYIDKLKIPQGVIIDIGANQGVMSVILKDNIPNTGIVCIEPALENIDHLISNVPDAVVHQVAISNINMTGSLQSFGQNQRYRVVKDTSQESITQISTLDSLNIESVMLIKVDVEGAEIDLLQGAVSTIEKYKPILYLEHHWDLVDKDELYSQIEKMNYQIIYLDGQTQYIHGRINNYLLIPSR